MLIGQKIMWSWQIAVLTDCTTKRMIEKQYSKGEVRRALLFTEKESHIPVPTRCADLEIHIKRDELKKELLLQ